MQPMGGDDVTDVLILGAGIAGLASARALTERGLRVTIVEARDRVGGRIRTLQADGTSVELGAEFVHGRTPELWALMDEAGLTATERSGSMLRAGFDGSLAEDDPQDDAMFAPLEVLKEYAGPDATFADWLVSSGVAEEDKPALLGYVEGFNAADAARIGILGLGAQQKAEDATEGDRAWHIRGGYAQLAEHLAAKLQERGGNLLLHSVVTRVDWEPQKVKVTTQSGRVLRASRCIVTLPLGVLQAVNAGGIEMQPLPVAIVEARRMAMGHAVRFTMVFKEPWWTESVVSVDREALQMLSFLFTPSEAPPVWWTAHPEAGPAMLTGWVGGTRSKEMRADALQERCLPHAGEGLLHFGSACAGKSHCNLHSRLVERSLLARGVQLRARGQPGGSACDDCARGRDHVLRRRAHRYHRTLGNGPCRTAQRAASSGASARRVARLKRPQRENAFAAPRLRYTSVITAA